MITINFFSTALGEHRIFALPFIVSSLLTNDSSFAEVIVGSDEWCSPAAKRELNKYFNGRYMTYQTPKEFKSWRSPGQLAAIRFLTVPRILFSKYTYISDCDILFLDKDIWKRYYEHMKFTGKPYSNATRPGQKRLTGLHCVKTQDYYATLSGDVLRSIVNRINKGLLKLDLDEKLLYTLVGKYFGMLKATEKSMNSNNPKSYGYRPVPGLHTSLSREAPFYGLNRDRFDHFSKLSETSAWKALFPHMDPKYKKMINHVVDHCTHKYRRKKQ